MPLIRAVHEDAPRPRARRKGKRACAELLRQLEGGDAGERRWAARDLADCPDASPALLDRLLREPDVSVREVILSSLVGFGDPDSVRGLVECLRSEDVVLRNEAIEAMKEIPSGVAPLMDALLADPDSDVRVFAVNVLESLRHTGVEQWLLHVIEHDPHVNVCATAVDLLGEVGTVAAREPLLRLKARFAEVDYIQFAADLALQRLTAPEG